MSASSTQDIPSLAYPVVAEEITAASLREAMPKPDLQIFIDAVLQEARRLAELGYTELVVTSSFHYFDKALRYVNMEEKRPYLYLFSTGQDVWEYQWLDPSYQDAFEHEMLRRGFRVEMKLRSATSSQLYLKIEWGPYPEVAPVQDNGLEDTAPPESTEAPYTE